MKIDEIINQIEKHEPFFPINELEFEEIISKFGSFITIYKNKKTNYASLLSIILDNEPIRKLLLNMLEYDNFNEVFSKILEISPNLARSKTIRIKYKKYIKKHDTRRTNSI